MEAFTEVKNRKDTKSMKWDQIKEVFQTDDPDLLPMWVADMDFPAPKEVNDALIKRAEHGIYGYTVIDNSIKENVTAWLHKRHDWQVNTDQLSFSPSVITSIYNAITSLTNEGDSILIQTPVYTPFFHLIKASKRQLVTNPLRFDGKRYEIDFKDLEEKMQQGVKAFLFCSPHNPVGRVWTREELNKLAELAIQYDVLILSDEIHADLVFKPHQHIPIASLSKEVSKRTITFMSPTKTFNLAGLHISYIICENDRLRKVLDHTFSLQGFGMLNTMGIIALDTAYREGEPWLESLLETITENKHYAMTRLQEETNGRLSVIDSEGTYLLWIDFQKLNKSDEQLQRFLVEEARVGLNAGTSYGMEGKQFMRLNLACPKATLQEGLDRIIAAVNAELSTQKP